MSALISRDPFARTELHREIVRTPGRCAWCGQPRPRLFRYRTETDGGRRFDHTGLFCSKACHDDYHA